MKDNSLTLLRKISKFYDELIRSLAYSYDLNSNDIKVCSFLMNNPSLDSAKHIVELRMLPKSNVSSSVDKLVVNGYLSKRVDELDHRQHHLALTEKAKPLCVKIDALNQYFFACLYDGIDDDLLKIQAQINDQMIANIDRARKEF